MRDPMSWAVPVFRAFGIQVKVHLLFFVITLGLFFRSVSILGDLVWWVDILLVSVVVLFLVILVHEFGHCFGARYVGGDAKEVLIWPLGGLAYVDVPHTPRALFISTAAGPAVNVAICTACAMLMAIAGYYPSLNPIVSPYTAEVHNYRDGRTYTSSYGIRIYRPGTADEIPTRSVTDDELRRSVAGGYDRATSPLWITWVYRVFWISWVLFLFNLIPAYPLDGGQMLQAFIWSRTEFRRGVVVAVYSGFTVAGLMLIFAIAKNESLFMGLGIFIFYLAYMKLHSLDVEDSPFGYDFSAGYTSLERAEEPVQTRKRPGYFARWQATRRARKLQKEADQRFQDEERMDQLLEKIARTGKESLSEDERRFLERVSARYRNRS